MIVEVQISHDQIEEVEWYAMCPDDVDDEDAVFPPEVPNAQERIAGIEEQWPALSEEQCCAAIRLALCEQFNSAQSEWCTIGMPISTCNPAS
jgi:hypothetical protein